MTSLAKKSLVLHAFGPLCEQSGQEYRCVAREALDTPRGKDLVSPPFTNTIHTDGIHSGDVPTSQLVTN